MFAEHRSVAKMAGREVLSIGISKAKGSSDVTVYHEVRKVLDELHRENPDVAFQELFTSVVYIEQQYESALHALMEGAVLAVLVVFLDRQSGVVGKECGRTGGSRWGPIH